MKAPTAISAGLLKTTPRTSEHNETDATVTIPAKLRRAGGGLPFLPAATVGFTGMGGATFGTFSAAAGAGAPGLAARTISAIDGSGFAGSAGVEAAAAAGAVAALAGTAAAGAAASGAAAPAFLARMAARMSAVEPGLAAGAAGFAGAASTGAAAIGAGSVWGAGSAAGAGVLPAAAAFWARIFARMSAVDGFFSSIANQRRVRTVSVSGAHRTRKMSQNVTCVGLPSPRNPVGNTGSDTPALEGTSGFWHDLRKLTTGPIILFQVFLRSKKQRRSGDVAKRASSPYVSVRPTGVTGLTMVQNVEIALSVRADASRLELPIARVLVFSRLGNIAVWCRDGDCVCDIIAG